MSADYCNYSNIDGNTAYLAGAVSAFADAYLCEILPKYWTLDCNSYPEICLRSYMICLNATGKNMFQMNVN